MPAPRKLGRATDVRRSILRGMVTTLIVDGRIETTVARAKEVRRIAEKLITLAIREKDNFSTREILASAARLDAKGRKILKSATSKNGRTYDVVNREMKTAMVQVDEPSRLAARRKMFCGSIKATRQMVKSSIRLIYCLTLWLPNTVTAPGAILGSSSLAHAAVMPPKWQSWN